MEQVRQLVESDPAQLETLIHLFCHGHQRVTQRAAWVLGNLSPETLLPFWLRILERAKQPDAGDAVKRNVMRVLQHTDLPEDLQGVAWDLAFRLAETRSEAIAVRAFAFSVMERICIQMPELKGELIALAQQERPYTQKGLLNRIQKVQKRQGASE